MELIIVTGLSGAGKSQAMHCLEDLGFYCIDNLPPKLMGSFITLAKNANETIDKVAISADIRGGKFFNDLEACLEELHTQDVEYKLMFLEASDQVLIRRYKETRRNHPMNRDGNILEGIQHERQVLEPIKKKARFVVDTSGLKAAGLNAEIKSLLVSEEADTFTINIESFGFKHGIPTEADFVFDARFIPNPFYLKSMKKLTGRNKKVRDYVLQFEESRDYIRRVSGLILASIPGYIREGKYHLSIGVGCTGGQHRSVVIASELARVLEANGRSVILTHRDL